MGETDTGSLIIDVEGYEITPEEIEMISHPSVMGIIFFSRNYESPEQLQQLVKSIRAVREELVLCVDQEGGRVQRFKQGFTRIPAMQHIVTWLDGQQNRSDFSKFANAVLSTTAWLLATELRSIDVDLSFAPVLDIDYKHNKVIGDRAFAGDPEKIVVAASSFIQGLNDAGMVAIGKHFPGHGFVDADSHFDLPYDHRPSKEIFSQDMWVFEALMDKLAGMMPAHIIYFQVDPDCPAGFSMIWLLQYLRNNLGYRGLIFSDDLCMEGAKKTGDIQVRANAALDAGCNILLVCNEPKEALKLLESEINLMTPGDKGMLRSNRPKVPPYAELAAWEKYRSARDFLLPVFDQVNG